MARSGIDGLSESDRERAKRFADLYRTLLTPVGLVLTVSGVFYATLANITKNESVLASHQFLIGWAVILLMSSGFLYGAAHMDLVKYRRGLTRWAFRCMMYAAFLASVLLIPPLISGWILGEDRTFLVGSIAFVYVLVGVVITEWFCRSKL